MRSLLVVSALAVIVLAGCRTVEPPEPDYARPLPPGRSALVRVGGGERIPDPAVAFRHRDPALVDALDQSLEWFRAPSSQRFFPFEDICTHEQAAASIAAFRDLVTRARGAFSFRTELWEKFDVYRSVGWDGYGTVLFTGYYSPEFPASRERTSRFRYPLYRRPADLATEPVTGKPLGRRRSDGSLERYPTRREIEASGLLAGTELVWLADPLSAYIVHVNGSARLRLPDGETIHVGYAGKTDRPYSGLGRRLLDAGLVDPNHLSLAEVRKAYQRQPARVRELIQENESYVFFTEYDGADWPSGSLGVPVTTKASLATDKRIYPRGGVVMVDTRAVTNGPRKEPFLRFMLDQDTGGAIRAPGRADIFMGIGNRAETLAGGQYAEGTLYYFILKPRYVEEYRPAALASAGP